MSFPWQILVLLTILWVFLLSTNPQVFSHLKNMLPRSYNVQIWWTTIYFRNSLNLSEIRLFWSSSCWSYSFLQCIRCSLVSLLHHTWHSICISTIYLYIHDPRELHLQALKQILCYLCGTLHHVLQLHISPTLRCWLLWSGLVRMPCHQTFHFRLLHISWQQSHFMVVQATGTISISNAKAKYCGVAKAVVKSSWIQNLLLKLWSSSCKEIIVYCDNVNVVSMYTNPF